MYNNLIKINNMYQICQIYIVQMYQMTKIIIKNIKKIKYKHRLLK